MRTVSSATLAALGAGMVKKRDFVWVTGYDFNTRAPFSTGFWNDIGNIAAPYIDVNDGSTQSRTYYGAGTLLTMDPIPLVADITVRNFKIGLSQIDSTVANLVRGYDVHGAPIEVHRGIFNPGTFQLVDPAEVRFVGFIDTMDIVDPKEGADGSIAITCVSHTRLLTRINTSVRSDTDQKLRNASDTFYKDTPTVGDWQIWWGQAKGSVNATTPANTDVNNGAKTSQ